MLTDAKSVVQGSTQLVERQVPAEPRRGQGAGTESSMERCGEAERSRLLSCACPCGGVEQRQASRGSSPRVTEELHAGHGGELRAARYFGRPRECDRFRPSGETGDLLQAGQVRHPLDPRNLRARNRDRKTRLFQAWSEIHLYTRRLKGRAYTYIA